METQHDLHTHWGWILTFGCLSILLGIVAIVYSALFTLVSVFFLGSLLIAAGVIEAAYLIQHRDRSHLLFYAIEAVLAIIMGFLLLRGPIAGALVITLLLASYFLIAGAVRVVAALSLRFPNWGWTLVDGLISIGLGIIVWGGWPASSFWLLGLFIGINLMIRGWSRIMLGLALKTHHFRPVAV